MGVPVNVHVGQLTSEVRAAPAVGQEGGAGNDESAVWDERAHLAAVFERVARDRRRTATGRVDD